MRRTRKERSSDSMDCVWLEVVTGSVKCQDGDLSASDEGTWLLSPGGGRVGVGDLSKESCDSSFPVSAK